MIRFDEVTKSYDMSRLAVDSVSLEIERGEFLVLVGPSGCGKTTTLKMINRLIPLTKGTIWLDGKRISDYPIHELRWQIGYVLQQIALFPHMTIEENIAVVPELVGWKKKDIRARVTELLEMVGLDPQVYRKRKPHELSGGQQQRIGVVRALAADPDILLMDEPFSALDPISRLKLQDDLLELQNRIQKTIVFVTHDLQEAFKLGDRVCIMNQGKIEQIATPQEILTKPASPFVREFTASAAARTFSIKDHIEEIPTDLSLAFAIPIDSEWGPLLQFLASEDQVAIKQNGQVIGMVTRKGILQFLAEQSLKGGTSNE
ncbi:MULTISPECIES: ABC transporter ATP-binding protein [unclassified Sporosarcina]|uniref:ABC transporter ATP-binding protein n=1 Tax=unclassified Sporosarcina TaxID=2647733 RepID=UPI000C16972F|nr:MULTISPECIES: ABC transporter ATP-binding protein [unclassified Sporosarcina]PID05669.1 glycine/betaine ABC transporter ATP-binding protein [Sporosarcina sp. P30]PID08863.1 glycine/betaine ABC transporter ATP-binding protein [Sporosarcina sp. P31]PID11854.1 glycine/betaine ABC transporter ATP-binding protein [Sporosarcina sp. P32b]